jgi:imidazolonepropionase-like amidohydrolase
MSKEAPMKKIGSWPIVGLAVLSFSVTAYSQTAPSKGKAAPPPLALEHAAVFDGPTGSFLADRTLVLEKGLISGLFESGKKALPEGARVVDLTGKFVIPGLIDAHVHIASDPSGFDRRDQAVPMLNKALRGGVTYIRDMAGDNRALADLVRAVKSGEIVAPDIRYSALMAGSDFFKDPRTIMSSKGETPGQTPWGRAVGPDTDLTLAIAEGRGSGAAAIKIYTMIAPDLLGRIVREAHRQGMPVWSHATVPPGKPGDTVAAGVDVVSHAEQLVFEGVPAVASGPVLPAQRWLSPDLQAVRPDHPAIVALLKRMAGQGTILDATLITGQAMLEAAAKDYPKLLPVARRRFGFACGVTRLAREMGVSVCAGTDGLLDEVDSPFPSLHREMELLVREAGFTPAAAIQAATGVSARALGIEKSHGTIAVGFAADLVVLAADPLADIRRTREVALVIKSGREVR